MFGEAYKHADANTCVGTCLGNLVMRDVCMHIYLHACSCIDRSNAIIVRMFLHVNVFC